MILSEFRNIIEKHFARIIFVLLREQSIGKCLCHITAAQITVSTKQKLNLEKKKKI